MQFVHILYLKKIKDTVKIDRINLCRHGVTGFESVLSLNELFININVTMVS